MTDVANGISDHEKAQREQAAVLEQLKAHQSELMQAAIRGGGVVGAIGGAAIGYPDRRLSAEELTRHECLAAALWFCHYDKHDSVLDAARAFEAYLKGEGTAG